MKLVAYARMAVALVLLTQALGHNRAFSTSCAKSMHGSCGHMLSNLDGCLDCLQNHHASAILAGCSFSDFEVYCENPLSAFPSSATPTQRAQANPETPTPDYGAIDENGGPVIRLQGQATVTFASTTTGE